MKHLFVVIFLLLGLTHITAQAEERIFRRAVEAGSIELVIDDKGNGNAIARECVGCPLELTISSETRFRSGSRDISLDDARRRTGKGGTVFFEDTTMKAIKITW